MSELNTGFSVTTLAMITFVKQMMITINYRDGLGDYNAWMTSREKSYALKDRPSLLQYCSYLFNLQSSVIGPCFEFSDWENY